MQAPVKSRRIGAALLSALLLTSLAGCGSLNPFSGSKPRNQPAPLVNFTPSMTTRTLWTANVGKSGDFFLMPAVAAGKVYAAGSDGELAAIDAANGKSLWRTKVAGGITAGVASDGTTVVVAGGAGNIIAFDAKTGKQRWAAQASTEILSVPAVGGGVVVVRSSRTGGGVVERNVEIDDDRAGFLVAEELNPQKARVLLMLGLTRTREPAALQALFREY